MLAVVDCRFPEDAQSTLWEYGYETVKLPPHPHLSTSVASHPDMLLFFVSDAILTTRTYVQVAKQELKRISEFLQKPILTVREELGNTYPQDILLNAAPIGRKLFCYAAHTATELTHRDDFEVCSVRQGYAKCSVLPVGKQALITEDPSIASTAKNMGLDVLKISAGAVQLSPYPNGFLGGASSLAPYQPIRKILFCGNLDLHPDADSIRHFLQKHGYEALSLSKSPLLDVGTIYLI